MLQPWGLEYKQAIALLAQVIYESSVSTQLDRSQLDWDSLWDSAVKKLPNLQKMACQVEESLDYELSYNQCCNAVSWVYQCDPSEWAHLLPQLNIKEE